MLSAWIKQMQFVPCECGIFCDYMQPHIAQGYGVAVFSEEKQFLGPYTLCVFFVSRVTVPKGRPMQNKLDTEVYFI